METDLQVLEKHAYFKEQDIAAMCVDIALTLNNRDLNILESRIIRNLILNEPVYNEKFKNITDLINSLGKELVNKV